MSTEKITDARRMLHWPGHMETDYVYTLGVAGERFFTELADNGRILGAKCPHCEKTFVPPRLYCEECFMKLTQWVDVGTRGEVYTFTVAYTDINGASLEKPIIYALIKFEGAEGGIIHRLGEIEPHEVRIGMRVAAVLKPQVDRKRSINDIIHFRPED